MKNCKLKYKKFNLNQMEFYIKVNQKYKLPTFVKYVKNR